MRNFCFCQLSMQILWRRRCSRVVDLKLPNYLSHNVFLTPFSCAWWREKLFLCSLCVRLKKVNDTTQINKVWSSQLWTQFMQLRLYRSLKKSSSSTGFEPVTSRYRCDALTYEATDDRSWSFVVSNEPEMNDEIMYEIYHILNCRYEFCIRNCINCVRNFEDHSLLDFIPAFQILKYCIQHKQYS